MNAEIFIIIYFAGLGKGSGFPAFLSDTKIS
jgi:hypothetical protein